MKKVLWFLLLLVTTACKDKENENIEPQPKKIEICSSSRSSLRAPYDNPVWHPNGKIIGYDHMPLIEIRVTTDPPLTQYIYDDKASGFYLMNSDGTNPHKVLSCPIDHPAWSPDGKWMVFVMGEQIYKMPFDGNKFDTGAIVQLTFGDNGGIFPAWSPDGEWIAYDSNYKSPNGMNFIWKIKSNGTAHESVAFVPLEGETRMPTWNKDFTIAYMKHKRFGDTDAPEIFGMDANGGNNTRLTKNDDFDKYPKFSPDGQLLGYISYSTKVNKGIEVYVSDRYGNNPKKVTDSGVEDFSWSPNNKEIVYLRYKFGPLDKDNGTLWVVDINTLEHRQLTSNNFK